jgi:hypothetical protein
MMRFERVLAIWDIYDGPRTGIAEFNGIPHYFECIFDESAGDYSNFFRLSPVSEEFLQYAARQWAIFRSWEARFHRGLVSLESHPGHGKLDAEYDRLGTWLNTEVKSLKALPGKYAPIFRPLQGQEGLPPGILRDLEAAANAVPKKCRGKRRTGENKRRPIPNTS